MNSAVLEDVLMAPALIAGIKDHCQREARKGGYEAIGFLARKRGHDVVTTRVALNNHSPDPQNAYFVEPWEQFRAERALAEGGYEIVGVYHSHPSSEAQPSRTDKVAARPGELMVIYSVMFDELTAWRECRENLLPVALTTWDKE